MINDTTGASLYYHAMGRAFKVVALADTDAEANTHMERTPGASVIDCYAGLVIMADKEDKGRKLTSNAAQPSRAELDAIREALDYASAAFANCSTSEDVAWRREDNENLSRARRAFERLESTL